MHLLNTSSRQLQEFSGPGQVKYAILSHRWTEEEVTFEDIRDLASCSKNGVSKVTSFCEIARALGFDWCWIDTCCINKASSAELSEAINSMFSWYQNAGTCIAYLKDVTSTEVESKSFESEFRASSWFLRSWTLQELLASAQTEISYYNVAWQLLGSGSSLSGLVSEITTIDEAALLGRKPLSDYCIAERMTWASMRSATRIEDIAYSLLGIFDIQMPLVYGEGLKAFRRLQQAIMVTSDDETIFAWEPATSRDTSLLARSPSLFATSRYLRHYKPHKYDRTTYELMSRGVRFDSARHIRVDADVDVLLLNVVQRRPDQHRWRQMGIYLKGNRDLNGHRRVWVPLEHQLWRGEIESNSAGKERDKSFYIPFDHDETVEHHIEPTSQSRPFSSQTSYGYDISMVPPAMLQLAHGKSIRDDRWLLDSEKGNPFCNIKFQPLFHGVSVVHLGIDSDLGRPICTILSIADDVSQAQASCDKLDISIRDLTIDYSNMKTTERQLLPDRTNNGQNWYIPIWPKPTTDDLSCYQAKLWQHPKQQPDLNYFCPFPFDPKLEQGRSEHPVTSCEGWGVELLNVGPGKWKIGFAKFTIVSNWSSKLKKSLVSKILASKPTSLVDSTYSIDLDTFKSAKKFP